MCVTVIILHPFCHHQVFRTVVTPHSAGHTVLFNGLLEEVKDCLRMIFAVHPESGDHGQFPGGGGRACQCVPVLPPQGLEHLGCRWTDGTHHPGQPTTISSVLLRSVANSSGGKESQCYNIRWVSSLALQNLW